MARLGGMSSETFSSPSSGLGSILRDQKAFPGAKSSRTSVIIGTARPPVKQSVCVSSPPVDSFLLEADMAGDGADELKEEDIWYMEDSEEGLTSWSDFRKPRMGVANELQRFTPKQKPNGPTEDLGFGLNVPRVNAGEVVLSSRLQEKGSSIVEAFVSNGSMGHSQKFEKGASIRMPSRRPSASRMIPLSGGSGKDLRRRHAERRSAPVEVPNWSKIMAGHCCKTMGGFMDEDENDDIDGDDERLPPHELLAREYSRSQRTTFSVCEGLGRTLKGRDLSRVRNAVWRQMGFAD